MLEQSIRVHTGRSELLRHLRRRLPKLADPLEIVAEQILGLESRIDFVVKDRRGQVVLVFVAEPGADLALLGNAMAQRSWMEPRVEDWLKLAPQLGLRPELGVRVLLLASRLDPRTVAAVESVEGSGIELGVYRCVQNGAGIELLIDLMDAPPAPGWTPLAEHVVASRFRTGLREEELGR